MSKEESVPRISPEKSENQEVEGSKFLKFLKPQDIPLISNAHQKIKGVGGRADNIVIGQKNTAPIVSPVNLQSIKI